jgi:predicted MFS family arabinose efflux permease
MRAGDARLLTAVYAALGAGIGGFQLSAQNLALEFGSRDDLPMRIAVANSASELVAAVGAVLGGALVTIFSYRPLFWTAIGFQLAALALVAVGVDEPRRR